MICQKEVPQLLLDEGFESKPYQDTLGVWTIGHSLTFLTEEESRTIVEVFRLPAIQHALFKRQPWIKGAHPVVQMVLINMAYQLGVEGVSAFKKTILALRNEDYATAGDEMVDSKWFKQTPNRAQRLINRIRGLSL